MSNLRFYVAIVMAVGGAFGAGWSFRGTLAPVKEEVVAVTDTISIYEEIEKCKNAIHIDCLDKYTRGSTLEVGRIITSQ